MPNPKLVLIDGHSLAFRAFHALPPDLATSKGELTNAVFGFTSMLLNVLREQQPAYVAVAFDVGKTFRHEMFEAYKGHRERTPDELRIQVERIKEILDALKIPIFTVEGYEADDVLSTLARRAGEQDIDSVIVTGDRDMLQIVDERISVLTSGRRFSDILFFTPERVEERYGLQPEQMLDLKALLGDKSDNIPGVRGIGEKSATSLLQKYGSLKNIYDHLSEVSPARAQTALREGQEDAWLSRELGKIVTDVPVEFDLEACRMQGYDRERVVQLFHDLSFRTLMDRLPPVAEAEETAPVVLETLEVEQETEDPGQLSLFAEETTVLETEGGALARATLTTEIQIEGIPPACLVVADEDALQEVARRLAAVPMIAFDTETTSVDPHAAGLVGVSVAWGRGDGDAAYIPLGHLGEPALPWETVRAALQPAFADTRISKVAHNASYDLSMAMRYGLTVAGELIDTMVAEWLLDPGSHMLGLKDLAWARLQIEMTPITQLIGTGKKQITMDQVPVSLAAPYACADAIVTLRLADLLLPELEQKRLISLFRDVEMPLSPVLAAMEAAGIKLDVAYLKEMSVDLTARLRRLERQIYEIAGYAFNVNSTQQLSDVLFGKLGLPVDGLRKTQAGAYSTAAEQLESLRGKHEIIDLILEQRQLNKLLSTYVDNLPHLVNPRTGRLHTSFNQTGAETGRVSSSTPNLQNIPVRTELGREIRRAFVAEEGWQLLSADYSQVELRILAHVSRDEGMLAAFRRNEDIHASAAAAVFGVPLAWVTKEQREVAKTMNFATSYGVSAFGLSQNTGLSRADAEQFMARYFTAYPGVRQYIEQTKAMAHSQGYVETLLGRRRFFPVLRTTAGGRRAHIVRQAAERAAINHPIQGTAADIIKIAMAQLYRALKEGGYRSRMLLQVHDELVLEVPPEEIDPMCELVCRIMENAYTLDAPLKVDLEAGPNWYEMAPLESW